MQSSASQPDENQTSDHSPAWRNASLPGCYTRLLSEWLAQQPYPSRALRTAIEAREPSDRIPAAQWISWLQQASNLGLGTAEFLAIGACAEKRHFGMLGHLVACHSHLIEALQAYQNFERLQYGISVSELGIDSDNTAKMRWLLPPDIAYLPAENIAVASMHRFFSHLLEIDRPFAEVHFAGNGSADAEIFSDFFGCPVFFNHAICGVSFAAHALTQPIPQRSDDTPTTLTQATHRALAIANDDDPIISEVLALLPRHLHTGGALATHVSKEMGIAPRSLHHRLASTAWPFRDLLGSVRQQAAMFYLNTPGLSLAEVAFLLGYAEQSSFQRAFKTWFGTTPRAWRRHQ